MLKPCWKHHTIKGMTRIIPRKMELRRPRKTNLRPDDTDQDPVHAVVPVLSAVGHVTRIDAIGVGIDTGGRETDLAVEKEERKGERDPSHP